MKIIDEQMWKQALIVAARHYYQQPIDSSKVAGEAIVFDGDEIDGVLLPDDTSIEDLPDQVVGYTYTLGVGEDTFGYALVNLECTTLYVIGIVEGDQLVWYQEGGETA
ncbi:hypothetical protein JK167_13865 [Levilactobacillus brevis]|uniref:Uncharacterized protein n=1 Tax=Levilactobacillus brevis TaxID=1580 RepID=A0AA41ES45_LEVBR|nr:hypothetical protein [Levilactobacillus brevis]MBS0948713.1 hypothetical protein [Levilactobacillus brevis]MBS1011876.1 hypothetical protein [Levilactobacillus brevis]